MNVMAGKLMSSLRCKKVKWGIKKMVGMKIFRDKGGVTLGIPK